MRKVFNDEDRAEKAKADEQRIKEIRANWLHAGTYDIPFLLGIIERLQGAITEHHSQKADDRCIEDDDKLYAAAGLPPCDRRVGDKSEMLKNCARFIERRCEAGGWPTYRELESKLEQAQAELARLKEELQAWIHANPHALGCEILALRKRNEHLQAQLAECQAARALVSPFLHEILDAYARDPTNAVRCLIGDIGVEHLEAIHESITKP